MKKYLGFICFIYLGIIIYIWFSNLLKNFLAPNLELYIKLSLIPLFFIGLVMIFNNKNNYKFKLSDLVLIIPLVAVILIGDGKLTTSFASNRIINLKSNEKVIKKEQIIEEKEDVKPNEENELYDFNNITFDIIDETYNELANYITFSPNSHKYLGETIRVRGFTLKNVPYLEKEYFMIGKYVISCCVADAEFIGFVAKYDLSKIKENTWYEIEGILEQGKDKEGMDIIYIKGINLKEIDSQSEEQYVYPCYAYDDGMCKELFKYDLT